MSRGGFEKLDVYRLSEKLADMVWEITKDWQARKWETIGRQLVRAADSVGANIAEGTGRGSYVDNRRFVLIARGSFEETRHWLRRAHQRDLLSKEECVELGTVIKELGPKLNGFLRSIPKQNQRLTKQVTSNR